MFDPYAGHSWADGPANFAAGNNQESSSEALNFANALIQWGAATGNAAVRDLGVYLYTTEVAAVEQYWFDVDDAVFPAGYEHNTVGIVWGEGVAYATWWTANVEEIHGINFLPFTGGSLYLGHHPDYVRANYSHMVARNGGPETEWVDRIWMFQATADPGACRRTPAA
jgi:endoglucanase Acf2